jgi:tetratricopeptide (TPR) repeat protein
MNKKKTKKTSFFKDIINRRVPQIVGIYLAISWGIIQFVIWLVNEFVLSPFLPQFTFVLLLSMLPTVVLFSYFHGKSGRDDWTRIEKIGVPVNIIFTIVILIFFFQGKELGAADKKVTIYDEAGNRIERTIIKNQFRKKIAVFAFENLSNDSSDNWLRYGMPYLLEFDLTQDMYIDVNTIYDFTEKIRRAAFSPEEKLPLTLQLKIARDSHLKFLLNGTFVKKNQKIETKTRLFEVNNGKQIAENSFTNENIFDIVDHISIQLKKDLNIPRKHLENVKDLPVSEITTSSSPALQKYIRGRNMKTFYNNHTKAISLTKNAVQEDPLFTIAYLRLAILYLNNANVKEYQKAIKQVMKKIYMLPERIQFEVKAIYFQLDEQLEKSFAVVKMWTDLYPEDIEGHKKLCSFYLNNANQIDMAISEVEKILEIDPSQYNYLQVLGNMYKKTGNYEQALKYYEQYSKHFPENVESFISFGSIYETIGDFTKALNYYEKALLFDPDNSDILIHLADIEKKTGNFLKAEEKYNKALKNCQTSRQRSEVFEALENLFLLQGQVQKAIQVSELKAEERKKYWDPLSFMINEIANLEKFVDIGKEQIALNLIRNTKIEPPLDKLIPFCYLMLYVELEDAENIEKEIPKAEELFRSFGISDVQNYYIYAKGKLKELRNDYNSALEFYHNYLHYRPASTGIMVRIGVCYKKLKKYDDAIQSIKNSLKILPVNAKAIYELALVFAESGDKKRAVEYLNQALDIWKNADPEFIPAQKARKKLAELTNV